MNLEFESDVPIFVQIAEELEDGIFSGGFPEETQLPSTTEISVNYKINPATVLKGINLLVDRGVAYKKRGVGIFVSTGAVASIRKKRQENFYKDFIERLLIEAAKLGISKEEIIELLRKG